MGVPGLWQELAGAAINRTLAEIAWDAWSKERVQDRQFLRLGIDASLWLFHARKSRGGKNPALRALFFRLARLLALPITPVFVLDGKERPRIKRDTLVHTGAHVIQTQFCEMLRGFGFAYWEAPGEAEAELAWMDMQGLLDAVLTDDVDALLFGAKIVVRHGAWNPIVRDTLDEEEAMETAAVYDTSRGAWKLDCDGMVLIALLSGADYDTQGLFNCGVKTAVGLAKAGFGTRLVTAYKKSYPGGSGVNRSEPAWDLFLSTWTADMRSELRNNASGHLGRRMPKLAVDMPPDFMRSAASRKLLSTYIWPRTSECVPASVAQLRNLASVLPVTPLHRLAPITHKLFQWTKEAVAQRFVRLVYSGLVFRALHTSMEQECENAAPHTPQKRRSPRSPRSPVSQITDYFSTIKAHSPSKAPSTCIVHAHALRPARCGAEIRVSYTTASFAEQVGKGLGTQVEPETVRTWLPVQLLTAQGSHERALCHEVERQHKARKQGSPTKKQRAADQTPLTSFFAVQPASSAARTILRAMRTHVEKRMHVTPQRPAQGDVFSGPDDSVELVGIEWAKPAADIVVDTSNSSVELESPRAVTARICKNPM
ncbi:hypothetical protein MVES1_000066 [Malassezia vespertilionis]|uniref:uncharacterized protein n=1 Tax=Malassezia vespertilionis TaxID=2020962 RepID=UPI0024B192E3|nr:uncharacterized protein MVES1_000066 [Malassezia vespertilionis]WFD04742.1 hypothetical protein MVES1_000066 [Malassezia vespertilionis]